MSLLINEQRVHELLRQSPASYAVTSVLIAAPALDPEPSAVWVSGVTVQPVIPLPLSAAALAVLRRNIVDSGAALLGLRELESEIADRKGSRSLK